MSGITSHPDIYPLQFINQQRMNGPPPPPQFLNQAPINRVQQFPVAQQPQTSLQNPDEMYYQPYMQPPIPQPPIPQQSNIVIPPQNFSPQPPYNRNSVDIPNHEIPMQSFNNEPHIDAVVPISQLPNEQFVPNQNFPFYSTVPGVPLNVLRYQTMMASQQNVVPVNPNLQYQGVIPDYAPNVVPISQPPPQSMQQPALLQLQQEIEFKLEDFFDDDIKAEKLSDDDLYALVNEELSTPFEAMTPAMMPPSLPPSAMTPDKETKRKAPPSKVTKQKSMVEMSPSKRKLLSKNSKSSAAISMMDVSKLEILSPTSSTTIPRAMTFDDCSVTLDFSKDFKQRSQYAGNKKVTSPRSSKTYSFIVETSSNIKRKNATATTPHSSSSNKTSPSKASGHARRHDSSSTASFTSPPDTQDDFKFFVMTPP